MTDTPESTLLFSPTYDEIGTRIVDLVNQVGFLYRYPEVAGVTLACISQHIQPLEKLLDGCAKLREAFSQLDYKDGSRFGDHIGADPLEAAFNYGMAGFDRFLDALRASTTVGDPVLQGVLEATERPDAKKLLSVRDAIDALGPSTVATASKSFTPIPEIEWQKLRLVIVYFLLDLQHAPQDDGKA